MLLPAKGSATTLTDNNSHMPLILRIATVFRSFNGNGTQEISICLDGDEVSDAINFVLKDEACGAWYDNNGSNFKVVLRPQVPTTSIAEVQPISQVTAGA